MGRPSVLLWAALALGASDAGAGGAHTSITVFAARQPAVFAYGGVSYGGAPPPSGAMITEQRELDVTSGGEVRITGVAATVDPATVQLRSLTDPGGVTVREQRFVPGATTPDEMLARHTGDPITVVTPRGEISGVLRSVDAQMLVLEVGHADQRRLQMMRRDGYVLDIRLPAGKLVDAPSLVWRLATKKPGKHTVEVTYRADGLAWTADYLAIYDAARQTVDFSAWASLRNATGTSFDAAEVTLVGGGPALPSVTVNPYTYYGAMPLRQTAPPVRFTVPAPVHLGRGEAVQVELLSPQLGVKVRPIITYEAVPTAEQMAINYQQFPATDCTMLTQTAPGIGRAEVAVEIAIPGGRQLPDGRVRVFARDGKQGGRLDVLGEEPLRTAAGAARIRLATHGALVGERRTTCTVDERTRTLTEKVEVELHNKSKQAIDTVVREVMWRFSVWRIAPGDETVKGARVAPQVQEYRLAVPAGGTKTVAYTVVYQWP